MGVVLNRFKDKLKSLPIHSSEEIEQVIKGGESNQQLFTEQGINQYLALIEQKIEQNPGRKITLINETEQLIGSLMKKSVQGGVLYVRQKPESENIEKGGVGSGRKKLPEKGTPDWHKLRIAKDTVKNPLKGTFLGGPTLEEAKKTLEEYGIMEKSTDTNNDLDLLTKSNEDQDDVIYKAEGSRGGKVIGHTKSGKPVYETHSPLVHQDFTAQDHLDAAELHIKKRKVNSKKEDEEFYMNGNEDNEKTRKFADKSFHHSVQKDLHEKFARQENDKLNKKHIK